MERSPKHVGGVAFITGAAGAIGSTVARRLSKGGWKIAGIDLRKSSAELALQVDVTDQAAMDGAVAETNKRLGPISLLVTAAGIFESAPMGRMPLDRWRRLLDVWLGGTRNACAAVLPEMLLLGRGNVVTLSAGPNNSDESNAYYAAATGTISGFMKSLSLEVAGSGVCVNCISPEYPADAEGVSATVAFLAEAGNYYIGQVFSSCVAEASVRR